jgi:hypothetical protein
MRVLFRRLNEPFAAVIGFVLMTGATVFFAWTVLIAWWFSGGLDWQRHTDAEHGAKFASEFAVAPWRPGPTMNIAIAFIVFAAGLALFCSVIRGKKKKNFRFEVRR